MQTPVGAKIRRRERFGIAPTRDPSIQLTCALVSFAVLQYTGNFEFEPGVKSV